MFAQKSGMEGMLASLLGSLIPKKVLDLITEENLNRVTKYATETAEHYKVTLNNIDERTKKIEAALIQSGMLRTGDGERLCIGDGGDATGDSGGSASGTEC